MPVVGRRAELSALVGQTIAGKYHIERLVGSGGMGAVYEALNLSINKRVALKFLFRDDAIDSDSAARFQREAEAASAVNSAHIVQIFDAGTSEHGRPYLVMELLEGADLRHRLKRAGRLPLEEVVVIAKQLLRALGRAHAAGIVHRDLKPDNIFICPRDDDPLFVKVLDFGISKVVSAHADTLTRRGTVLGTAHYMSPEQAQAFSDVDGRADLFSLGAIMYEALAGRPPHIGKTFEAVLIHVCTTAADDIREHAPNVPEAIAQVIAKSIERDRDHRYQSAHEFALALEQCVPDLYHFRLRSESLPSPSAQPRESAFADTEQSETPPLSDTAESSLTRSTRVEAPPITAPRPKGARALVMVLLVVLPMLALASWLTRTNESARQNGAASRVPTLALPGSSRVQADSPPARASGSSPVPKPSSAPELRKRTTDPAIGDRRQVELPAARGRAPSPSRGGVVAPRASADNSASGAPGSSGIAGQLRLKTEGP
jgi:eukaryotic-like serine/threonine-protein kinase